MAESPLSKIKRNQVVTQHSHIATQSLVNQVTPTTPRKSPLAAKSGGPVMVNTPITDADIEALGGTVGLDVSKTTEKIIQKMSVAKFGELGDILATVQTEADALDPKKMQAGVSGWLKKHFTDLQQLMFKQLKTAEAAFLKLEEKMNEQVKTHQQWIKDFDGLYQENYQRYCQLTETIKQCEFWDSQMVSAIDHMPPIDPADPEAPMQQQMVEIAQARLNRLRIKMDMFRRLKIMTEANGPKINSQRESSYAIIMTLTDLAQQAIPMIKMEFALHLQTQDVQRSLGIIKGSRDLLDASVKKSADAAKQASIGASQALNTPMLQTETLDYIRNRMLETVTEVRKVVTDAQTKRETDARYFVESQKQYLQQLERK